MTHPSFTSACEADPHNASRIASWGYTIARIAREYRAPTFDGMAEPRDTIADLPPLGGRGAL